MDTFIQKFATKFSHIIEYNEEIADALRPIITNKVKETLEENWEEVEYALTHFPQAKNETDALSIVYDVLFGDTNDILFKVMYIISVRGNTEEEYDHIRSKIADIGYEMCKEFISASGNPEPSVGVVPTTQNEVDSPEPSVGVELKKLLETCSDPNEIDIYGNSLLQKMVFERNIHACKVLIEKGAWVNFGNPTPLGIATINNDVEMVKFLIDHGADITMSFSRKTLGDVEMDKTMFDAIGIMLKSGGYGCEKMTKIVDVAREQSATMNKK